MDTAEKGTVRLHRVMRAPAERIYRAYIDPDAMAKWLPPNGFTGKVHSMDAKVGGSYRMSFTNFGTGSVQAWTGTFTELKPNELIRHTDKFDGNAFPGEMDTTITFKSVSVGTDVSVVQSGIPEGIPVDGCYLGWQDSLMLLAKLVEAEIPD